MGVCSLFPGSTEVETAEEREQRWWGCRDRALSPPASPLPPQQMCVVLPQPLKGCGTPQPPPHGPRSPPKPGPPRRAAAPHRAANRGAAAPSGGGGRGMRGSGGGCLCMWGGVSVPQPSRGWQVTRNCKNIPPFSFRRLLRSEEP